MKCPACESPVEGARCGGCGAAVKVREYVLFRVLGHSQQGRVYLARDRRQQTLVLKELLPGTTSGKEQLDRLRQEGKMLQSLSHPSLPRYVDLFPDGEGPHRRYFLALEHVEGRSLQEWLEQGPFNEAEVGDVAGDLLAVVEHLHSRTPIIVHRDIKPANVVMRPTGKLALVDFGAARFLEEASQRVSFIGTPGYAPPEQLTGTIDRTSDLYAVGATLIHLFSGKPPRELVNGDMELDFTEHVPARWAPFLGRLVARQAKRRFGSAREALAALDAVR